MFFTTKASHKKFFMPVFIFWNRIIVSYIFLRNGTEWYRQCDLTIELQYPPSNIDWKPLIDIAISVEEAKNNSDVQLQVGLEHVPLTRKIPTARKYYSGEKNTR